MVESLDKFEEQKQELLEQIRDGIKINFPLSGLQKKYLKNLLLFSIIKASTNEVAAPSKYKLLVNKIFKRFLMKILKKQAKLQNIEQYDEFYDENLEVLINNIIANEELLRLNILQNAITPKNIIQEIRLDTQNMNSKEMLKKVLSLREAKANHRETPAEFEKRKENIRQYEMERILMRQRERGRDGRSRG